MAFRALVFVAVIALSGCATSRMFRDLGIYAGPVLPMCRGPVTGSAYQSGKCLTRAEHDIALKKTRTLLKEDADSE